MNRGNLNATREDPSVTFQCDAELLEEFDEVAGRYGMSRSKLLRNMMLMTIRADEQDELNGLDANFESVEVDSSGG